MKKMFGLFTQVVLLLFLFSFTPATPQAHAADLRSGDQVTISSGAESLKDLYLFGSTIKVDSPITNDVVAAGGDITLTQPVSGSVIIAGGNLTINGAVGNTIRAAGGNIKINGPVTHDIVVAGGEILIAKEKQQLAVMPSSAADS